MLCTIFLELRDRCLDHAIGDSIPTWGFVRVKLFSFSNEFLSRDLFVERRE